METHITLVVGLLVLIIVWFVFMSSEFLTNNSKYNLDKFGNAIAHVVKNDLHFKEFKELIGENDFDPTMFDTLLHLQKNNWLSKPNLLKVLNADYKGFDKTTPNAY
jgi:hypothetical protein